MKPDISDLIESAISLYIESGKPGVPSLDASGVTKSKVQIRNDEGEILEEIERDAIQKGLSSTITSNARTKDVRLEADQSVDYSRRTRYALLISLPFFLVIYLYWRDSTAFTRWIKQITMNQGSETSTSSILSKDARENINNNRIEKDLDPKPVFPKLETCAAMQDYYNYWYRKWHEEGKRNSLVTFYGFEPSRFIRGRYRNEYNCINGFTVIKSPISEQRCSGVRLDYNYVDRKISFYSREVDCKEIF
jgi:hypothetical protein